jgi:1,4-dihydroxy-2-naphthoate polyprenyltransferase
MIQPIWYKSLKDIKPLEKATWQKMNLLQRWSFFAIASTFIMSFLPALYAGLLALRDGKFNLSNWVALVIGLVFAHATNNMANDITDFWRKVDEGDFIKTKFMPPPLHLGYMTLRESLIYAAVTGLVALIAGIYLVLNSGQLTLWLLAIGGIFVLFYTFPIKIIGLGELTVLLVWGPMMVGGGYYAITGIWSWNVLIASLPFAISASMVLIGRHLDKLEQDRKKGIHSLPVRLGEKNTRWLMLVMLALQYVIVLYQIITGFFSPWMLIACTALLLVPQISRVFIQPKPDQKPGDVPLNAWELWFIAPAQFNNLFFGITYAAGLILDTMLHLLIK